MRRPREHTPRRADLGHVRTIIRAGGTGYALVESPRRRAASGRPRSAAPPGPADQWHVVADDHRPARA